MGRVRRKGAKIELLFVIVIVITKSRLRLPFETRMSFEEVRNAVVLAYAE